MKQNRERNARDSNREQKQLDSAFQVSPLNKDHVATSWWGR